MKNSIAVQEQPFTVCGVPFYSFQTSHAFSRVHCNKTPYTLSYVYFSKTSSHISVSAEYRLTRWLPDKYHVTQITFQKTRNFHYSHFTIWRNRFQNKTIQGYRKEDYRLMNEKIYPETIANNIFYVSRTSVSEFIKEKVLQHKSHNDHHTLIEEDVNILTLPIERSSQQKLNKEIQEINNIL